MKIVIVGCGKIGSSILASLVREGHDIVVMDPKENVIDEITNVYDVIGIIGNGADYTMLKEAGMEETDVFIAVTGSDELNMLSCFIAKKMGASHTVARIRNPEYNEQNFGVMRQNLGISMAINPEMLTAQELFNIIKMPSAFKIETFTKRNFVMIEMRIREDSELNGMKLIDFRNTFKTSALICAVQRDDKVYIPDGNFILRAGDRIGLTATYSEIIKLLKKLELFRKQAKDIMIIGASRTAFYLSKLLIKNGSHVKIIEKDRKVCREFCDALSKADVINADGGQQEVLLEEGLRSHDALVALTGMDEENIIISIFAGLQNVPKVISKVNRDELYSMSERLGLDCIVSPRKIISDVLVRYARSVQNAHGSNVQNLYKLMDDGVEALEFNVKSDFDFLNVPIKELELKTNILIAGIIRERKAWTPSGDDIIMKNDKVVVFAAKQRLTDFSDIIA